MAVGAGDWLCAERENAMPSSERANRLMANRIRNMAVTWA
jgi:hypothetical protein